MSPSPTLTVADLFPLRSIRLSTQTEAGESIELRPPDEALLTDLACVAAEGVHEPGQNPFRQPWAAPGGAQTARDVINRHLRCEGQFSPDDWHLNFTVIADGEVVGNQDLAAIRFPLTRQVRTGSWLGRRHHGRGIGTAMRRAALTLAFDGLNALDARSAAWQDNHASAAVARKVGYEPDGTDIDIRGQERTISLRFHMSADHWRTLPTPPTHLVTMSGVDAARSVLDPPDIPNGPHATPG